MDYHSLYHIPEVTIAVFTYRTLTHELRSEKVSQNLATWVSWVLLDFVAGLSLLVQGGNWFLLAVYVAGGSYICRQIYGSAKFKIEIFEKITFALVIISIIIWTQFGPRGATFISTAGVVIATGPLIVDAITEPQKEALKVYLGFTLVNIFATLAGKEWNVEERLYPVTCVLLCGGVYIITRLSLSKVKVETA